MFEKEAEDNKPPYAYCSLNTNCELWKDGFQKGAEFGYNKAKEEMQGQGLALQSDMDKTIEQNIQLKKQNKWLEGCKSELAEHLGKANDRIGVLYPFPVQDMFAESEKNVEKEEAGDIY